MSDAKSGDGLRKRVQFKGDRFISDFRMMRGGHWSYVLEGGNELHS